MLDRPDASKKPGRRLLVIPFALLGVVVALLIAIAAVPLAAWPSCGCTSPTDLVVANYAHEDASVNWQGAGLFGTPVLDVSGSQTAPACTISLFTLRQGSVDVSIRDASDALSVQLNVPRGAGRSVHKAIIVIGADGQIAEPVHQSPTVAFPEGPLCD